MKKILENINNNKNTIEQLEKEIESLENEVMELLEDELNDQY